MRMKFDALKEKAKKQLSEGLRATHTHTPSVGVECVTLEAITRAYPIELARMVQDRFQIGFERPVRGQFADAVTQRLTDEVLKWEKAAHRLIDSTDVRNVAQIVRMFPEVVPAKFRNREIEAGMDGDGDWVVEFTDRPIQAKVGELAAQWQATATTYYSAGFPEHMLVLDRDNKAFVRNDNGFEFVAATPDL